LGKLLRIDVESGQVPYGIPATNPYAQAPGYRAELWALGLRNPWHFAFDRRSGDLYIGDVGQGQWEEIDFQPASSVGGENYGWRLMEGSRCFNPSDCDPTGLVLPVAEYSHARGWCSVTGGEVYRGTSHPRMDGVYFYGDYCTGTLWGLRREAQTWNGTILAETGFAISSFGQDEEGNVYVVDYRGAVYQLSDARVVEPTPTWTDTPAPTLTRTPEPTQTAVLTRTVQPTTTATQTPVPTPSGTHRVYLPIIIKQWLVP
jgi:glucose/arabinose dehydrogenase